MEKKKAKIIIGDLPAETKFTAEEMRKFRGGFWQCARIPGHSTLKYDFEWACWDDDTDEWEFY